MTSTQRDALPVGKKKRWLEGDRICWRNFLHGSRIGCAIGSINSHDISIGDVDPKIGGKKQNGW